MVVTILRRLQRQIRTRRPTLLARSLLLFATCLLINAVLWIISAIVFTRHVQTDRRSSASHELSLCLLAWTLGLRHGLDADHISIIDNATRRIASLRRNPSDPNSAPRRPVTCGLFFSLGHSTIVVSVLIAVAVSTSVVNHLGGVSEAGGIIGASVSGSFLFLFGIINSVLLWKSWSSSRRRRQRRQQLGSQAAANVPSGKARELPDATATEKDSATIADEKIDDLSQRPVLEDSETRAAPAKDHHFRGIFTRIAKPLLKMVDRPYKLYPIGILFGFGFDTASSIALLGVAAATNSAIVQTGGEPVEGSVQTTGQGTSDASIVLLALLFTAGMTLVDSCDSILMIHAYAPEVADAKAGRRWAFFESEHGTCGDEHHGPVDGLVQDMPKLERSGTEVLHSADEAEVQTSDSTSTALSHLLTLASIVLAFVVSAIQILGLIGENCARCTRAADKEEAEGSGGLEGRWWLFWRHCNDQSGLIGAGIVGAFAVILVSWYAVRAMRRRAH